MGQMGQKLLAAGHITEAQLEAADERMRQTGEYLGETLVAMGFVPARTVAHVLEEAVSIPYVDLSDVPIDQSALGLVSEQYQRRHRVLPYRIDGRSLYVAMADP